MRIRSRLLLLVLAAMLPLALGCAVGVAFVVREQQAFRQTTLRETARALALALDGEMKSRETVLHTLAGSPSLQEGNLERFHSFAASVAAEHEASLILSDLQGRQLLNSRLPYGTALPDMMPLARELRANRGPDATLVSNVYQPPAPGAPLSFAVQVPVRRNGRVEWFLTMAAPVSQVQVLILAQRLPAEWHATVIDREGIVAARSKEPQRYVGQPVRGDLREALLRSGEGSHHGQTLAGVPGEAYFSRAANSGWTFLVAVPDEVLYGPLTRTAAAMGALALFLIALAVLAAWAVARRIAQPVVALGEAAARLGRNEPVEAPASELREVDQVRRAMADASERLRHATSDLEQRVQQALASYQDSQRQLLHAQKLEALGRLTGGIAHDFNNVLQTLSSGLQAAGKAPPERLAELLASCQRAVARGTELARQLMVFGRVQEVRARTIDMAAQLLQVRPLLEGALPTNIALDYDIEPGLWPVTVDPAQLELALLNLVINARDAMGQGGAMALRASNHQQHAAGGELAPGDYVVIALSDTGQGMSEEVMAHAMDPFYTTKGVGKGTGMGLPQAYGFARQSGGTLRLQSEPGQGTTATLVLPRAAQAALADETVVPSTLPPARGKVLLVEDDDLVRETVATALAAAGFDIATASSGDEAWHRLEAGERFGAVFTDVVMPGALSGLDLAEHILRSHPGTGVVIATGYSDRKVDLPGVRALPKPYELQEAVDALNEALG
jgi:signal transduction histidine kinase